MTIKQDDGLGCRGKWQEVGDTQQDNLTFFESWNSSSYILSVAACSSGISFGLLRMRW